MMLLKSISIFVLLITGIAMMPVERKKGTKGSTPPPPLREVRIILPPRPGHLFEELPPPQEHNFEKRRPSPPLPYDEYGGELRNYEFNYLIDDDYTRNYQTREETKDGERVVGSYTMKEPTGALRVVKYVADEYGFRAMVRRLWPGREKS